uniref:DNA/RNA-binding domain-containing protein n=1 Tax=Davidia involucrata TaxID=16924 RepID=A0A5B6ZQ26_DAVIN
MNLNSPVPLKDQKERQNPIVEVVSAEKQLWTLIHSKGLLHTDVQDLYRKVRSGYEKIILNDHEELELQDVEYSLWKLHYKHIDEFRKRIRQSSANADSRKSATPQNVANVQNSFDSHTEGFKSFLSEATEFYQDLITKLRRSCGLPEEPLFYKRGGLSFSVEPTKLHKCQYQCHRFLVCLGDLARYRELCKKPDFQNRKWSVAATYYFEATMIWPDSGNPQNQLALLATYVGDDFLALYHCVRSLAVKEPFPDAWDNLILLFEKNGSSHLHSLSSEAHFDFLKPSERSISQTRSQSSSACGSLNSNMLEATEHVSTAKTDLWPVFVRMISFFFIKSSLEDFPCTFASTIRELEALVVLDDTELKAKLESYQHMDSARTGPYRALQVVSVLIFIIHSLTESSELKESEEKNDMHQRMLTQLALTATFICMGRILERCMKDNSLEFCPILPAVLVFVEWLVGMFDKAETYSTDEKVVRAMSYFFGAFVDLLNRLDNNKGEVSSPDHSALWEDYELRGFAPLDHAHVSLDFKTHWENMGKFNNGNACRVHRIFHAAMKIVERLDDSGKWIFYDKMGRKFCTAEPTKFPDQRVAEVAGSSFDLEVREPHQHKCGTTNENEKDAPGGTTKEDEKDASGENQSHPCLNGKSVAMEEEEVILFKPITRYNSAPICTSIITNDQISTEGMRDETTPSDECLRRASSLYIAQSQAQADPLNFHSDITNFICNNPSKQPEPLLKESATYPAGHPSLSAWVLNRESLNSGEKGKRDFSRHGLSPIEEIASPSFTSLSISETEDSLFAPGHVSATTHYFSPPYLAPVPSAPLLPDDAVWFRGNSSSFSGCKSSGGIEETDGILGASPLSSYTNRSGTHGPISFDSRVLGFSDGYPPLGLSSSEWLHQYTKNQNLERANNDTWPVHFYSPGNFHGHDGSRFDIFDRWGNPLASNQMVYLESPQLHPGYPLVYGADEQTRDNQFLGYQRPSLYGCGTGTELTVEQPPLLQYLKEREWQLQRESQVRGPTYMGN